MTSVTVLSGRERRRRWTAAEKLRIVAESRSAGLSIAEFARRHDVHPNLVHAWRRQAQTGELSVAADGEAHFVSVSVAADGEAHFVSVSVAGESSAAGLIADDAGVGTVVEVMLRNGRVLRLSEGVAPGRAALLADALEGCAR
jgi:transposase